MNIKIFRPFLAAISIFMLVVIPANAEDSLDISTILMRSTFKIQGNGTTGTVFILGEPLPDDPKKLSFVLMTATHVLTSIKSNQATLFLRTRKGDLYERLPYRIDIRKEGEPLWISHPDVDVSAMRIAIPKIADIKLISTDLLATDDFIKKYEVHCSDELFVLGFPYGAEANQAGFPILRSGRIASYPLTPIKIVKTFLLDFEVFRGNSGGPVFMRSKNRAYGGGIHIGVVHQVMGIVSQEKKVTEHVKSLDEEVLKKHKLSLAVVIHARFVKELLNLLPPFAKNE